MSPPPATRGNARLVQWLLLVPPCLPGILMLVVGWARDPLRTAWGLAPPVSANDVFARQQAGQLYAAGNIALVGGLLMAGLIAWKILRPAPLEEDEQTPEP